MPTLQSVLDDAVEQLAGVTESPRLDAELLICHALSLTRASFLMMKNDEVDLPNSFAPMLERRLNSEPIAYILAEWEFFSIPLAIRPPTLIPRPETEHLVEAAYLKLERAADVFLSLLPRMPPNARLLPPIYSLAIWHWRKKTPTDTDLKTP
jgi:release factor glutamine methyltransferase